MDRKGSPLSLAASERSAHPPRSTLVAQYQRRLAETTESLEKFVDVEFTYSPFRAASKRFVIAADGRTGSYLLCERLLPYGSVVQEFFQLKIIQDTCRRENFTTLQEYCEFVVDRFAVNDVFGVKGPIQIMAPLVLAGEIPDFSSEWRFVYLKRMNVLQQAISERIAKLTGAYRSSRQPARVLTDDAFDGEQIALTAKRRLIANATWEEMFSTLGVDPLRITYEDLAADPDAVAARTADYLDLRGPPITDKRFLSPPLTVQATELNARWERRFHDEGWRIEGPPSPSPPPDRPAA